MSNNSPKCEQHECTVRNGILLELQVMEYPRFLGSAMRSVRMPTKPLYLFKIECNDSLARETILVFAELTTQNEGAIAGMPVTLTSRRNTNSLEPVEHRVTLR